MFTEFNNDLFAKAFIYPGMEEMNTNYNSSRITRPDTSRHVSKTMKKSENVSKKHSTQVHASLPASTKKVSLSQDSVRHGYSDSVSYYRPDTLVQYPPAFCQKPGIVWESGCYLKKGKAKFPGVSQENLLTSLSLKSKNAKSFKYPVMVQGKKSFSIEVPNKSKIKDNTTRISHNQDWIFGLIMICLIILAFARQLYQKYIVQIFRSVVFKQDAETLFNNKNALLVRVYMILNLIFLFSGGLFAFLAFRYYGLRAFPVNDITNYFIFCGILGVVNLLFNILCKFFGAVFQSEKEYKEYVHNTYMFNKNLGLCLLPLNACIVFTNPQYSNYLIITGFCLCGIFYILRTVRGIKIILKKEFSILYLIFYLCTLEIVPLLIFYKVIKSLMVL